MQHTLNSDRIIVILVTFFVFLKSDHDIQTGDFVHVFSQSEWCFTPWCTPLKLQTTVDIFQQISYHYLCAHSCGTKGGQPIRGHDLCY